MKGLVVLATLILLTASPALGAHVRHGRALFVEGCSDCHGFDARGVPGVGPTLYGAGAESADFYLRTGRMPLDAPGDQPERSKPSYSGADLADLIAYVASLGGPPVPDVHPERGDLALGQRAFTSYCAGCHQVVARGGAAVGGYAPDLLSATPRQVAEAVRVGPYIMPRFGERAIDRHTLDSLARYVEWTHAPRNPGGWSLGELGPVPEGLVAWFLAGVVLVLFIRLLGERTDQ